MPPGTSWPGGQPRKRAAPHRWFQTTGTDPAALIIVDLHRRGVTTPAGTEPIRPGVRLGLGTRIWLRQNRQILAAEQCTIIAAVVIDFRSVWGRIGVAKSPIHRTDCNAGLDRISPHGGKARPV